MCVVYWLRGWGEAAVYHIDSLHELVSHGSDESHLICDEGTALKRIEVGNLYFGPFIKM